MERAEDVGGVGRERTRAAVVAVAADLLATGGSAAVTTRAVAAAAGVQAPTIYRLFGDKDGLLDAVAERVLAAYVEGKRLDEPTDDPVTDLDRSWDAHVGFGLANPAMFALLADPERGTRLQSTARGGDILAGRVHRVALAGRLAVPERRAVELIRAAGLGAVLTLLTFPPPERDLGLADLAYAAVKRVMIADLPDTAVVGAAAAATGLRAHLDEVTVLSPAERTLLAEWLDRVAAS